MPVLKSARKRHSRTNIHGDGIMPSSLSPTLHTNHRMFRAHLPGSCQIVQGRVVAVECSVDWGIFGSVAVPPLKHRQAAGAVRQITDLRDSYGAQQYPGYGGNGVSTWLGKPLSANLHILSRLIAIIDCLFYSSKTFFPTF